MSTATDTSEMVMQSIGALRRATASLPPAREAEEGQNLRHEASNHVPAQVAHQVCERLSFLFTVVVAQ